MASGDKKLQPVIVKKIRKANHSHHGGAWKIAYADFVTAMMAFFLLMWLLGSTTKGDLQGIADYFASPLQVAMSGGSGSGDATSLIKGGGQDLSRQTGQVRNGDIEANRKRSSLAAARAAQRREDRLKLEALKARFEQMIAANAKLGELGNQIRLDLTPEGLRIQIVDAQNRPMFDSGSAVVKDYMRELLREIGKVLNDVDNKVSLSGHTDVTPYGSGQRGYSNWELSADRANASRRELIQGGMDEGKVLRVIGQAASILLDDANPRSSMNRRISIVIMNREAELRLLQGAEFEVDEAADLKNAIAQPSADGATPPDSSTKAGAR